MAKFSKKMSAFLLVVALLVSLAPSVLAADTDAFSIVSVELDPIVITEGTNSEERGNPGTGFYYLYDWLQFVSGTATFSDGATVDFTAPGFAYDGQQYTLSGSDVQFMEHWDGGYTFSVNLNFVDETGAVCFTAYPNVTIEHDLDDATDPRVCKICGKTEDKTTWDLDEATGILTVGGTGPMKDYSQTTYHTPPWMYSTVTSAVIGEGVTHIGDMSFYEQRLASVSLPSTLTSIGNEAFSHGGLTEVKLPNGLTNIGEEAFLGTGLTELTVPASVTTIGQGAFKTYMLTTITFLGDAPTGFDTNPYLVPSIVPGLTVTIKYPADNATWTEEVKAFWSENANITWETFEHDWTEATCTAPKTCKTCGVTEGDALGHDFADATCAAPKTCNVCGATEGDALGHDFADATCAAPKTCKACGVTEGTVIDHADANADNKCDMCGKLMKEVNVDTNGDGKADLDIDTDADGKADVNVDRDGDNKADLNVDTDNDGKADENVDTDGDGLPNYEVVEGNNGQHEKAEKNDLVFKINGLFSGFQELVLNGQVVSPENYEAREGSTIITLKGSYLATLEEGSYALTVVYTDGTTDYSFDVAAEKPTEPELDSNVPQTGDTADILPWILLLTLSAAGIVCIAILHKKRIVR